MMLFGNKRKMLKDPELGVFPRAAVCRDRWTQTGQLQSKLNITATAAGKSITLQKPVQPAFLGLSVLGVPKGSADQKLFHRALNQYSGDRLMLLKLFPPANAKRQFSKALLCSVELMARKRQG